MFALSHSRDTLSIVSDGIANGIAWYFGIYSVQNVYFQCLNEFEMSSKFQVLLYRFPFFLYPPLFISFYILSDNNKRATTTLYLNRFFVISQLEIFLSHIRQISRNDFRFEMEYWNGCGLSWLRLGMKDWREHTHTHTKFRTNKKSQRWDVGKYLNEIHQSYQVYIQIEPKSVHMV